MAFNASEHGLNLNFCYNAIQEHPMHQKPKKRSKNSFWLHFPGFKACRNIFSILFEQPRKHAYRVKSFSCNINSCFHFILSFISICVPIIAILLWFHTTKAEKAGKKHESLKNQFYSTYLKSSFGWKLWISARHETEIHLTLANNSLGTSGVCWFTQLTKSTNPELCCVVTHCTCSTTSGLCFNKNLIQNACAVALFPVLVT